MTCNLRLRIFSPSGLPSAATIFRYYTGSIKTVAADKTRASRGCRRWRLSLVRGDPGRRSQTRLTWATIGHPCGVLFGGCAGGFVAVKANQKEMTRPQFSGTAIVSFLVVSRETPFSERGYQDAEKAMQFENLKNWPLIFNDLYEQKVPISSFSAAC
jgi:hypothetical protein